MKNEPVILGIDIGGTKVALAKVSETGRLLSQKRYPLRASSVLDFPRTLCVQIEIFLGDERPLGIGVGLKGMIAADCHTKPLCTYALTNFFTGRRARSHL